MANTVAKNKQGYGYKYTDIAQIHEYLESINVMYYQTIETDENGNDYILTVPIVDGKELAPRKGCKIVNAPLSGKSNPAQEQGSAITYARRYSLLMAFGLATDDDDAECLSRQPQAQKKFMDDDKINSVNEELKRTGITMDKITSAYKVKSITEFNETAYKSCMNKLKVTPDKKEN